MITSSNAQRIGDQRLSFGMKRYADDAGHALWRFVISPHPLGSDPFVEIDASVRDLGAMRDFCTKAIELLTTDGGREKLGEPARHGPSGLSGSTE